MERVANGDCPLDLAVLAQLPDIEDTPVSTDGPSSSAQLLHQPHELSRYLAGGGSPKEPSVVVELGVPRTQSPIAPKSPSQPAPSHAPPPLGVQGRGHLHHGDGGQR